MKFGAMFLISYPEGRNQADVYREAVEQIRLAEELGFDAVWLAEHHFSRYGICGTILGFAAHVAALTKRVRIGTAVVVLPFWNPLLVAEEAAMVDLLSRGRLDFGVGRGYQWNEFRGFNLSMEESRERFEESLAIIKQAWTEERFTYEGKHFQFRDVMVLPKPVQQPHPPIWIAGVSPDTIRWIAEQGYTRFTAGTKTIKQLRNDQALYDQALEELGRPRPESRPSLRFVHIGDSDEEVRRDMEGPVRWFFETQESIVKPPDWQDIPDQYQYYRRAFSKYSKIDYEFAATNQMLFGTAETVTRRMRELRDELDLNYFMCQFAIGNLPHEKVVRSMERFARDVMPALKQEQVAVGGERPR